MRALLVVAVLFVTALLSGWCGVKVAEAVREVERAAAERDAEAEMKAGRRQLWRDGRLMKNTTVKKKSRAMERVRRSTVAR